MEIKFPKNLDELIRQLSALSSDEMRLNGPVLLKSYFAQKFAPAIRYAGKLEKESLNLVFHRLTVRETADPVIGHAGKTILEILERPERFEGIRSQLAAHGYDFGRSRFRYEMDLLEREGLVKAIRKGNYVYYRKL